MPPFALERSLAADGLLAKIAVDKYADHIPLNRQAKRFKRECGVELTVSTMCGWMAGIAGLLKHVVAVSLDELKQGSFIQSDATGLLILEGRKNQVKRGHLWCYTDGVQVVYRSTSTGKQENPADVLRGFEGTLLTDGASAYNLISKSEEVTRAGCWAHARRKFFEGRGGSGAVARISRAGIALASIGALFQVEREVAGLSPESRESARQRRLRRVLFDFKDRLDQWSTTIRPRRVLGNSITHAKKPAANPCGFPRAW